MLFWCRVVIPVAYVMTRGEQVRRRGIKLDFRRVLARYEVHVIHAQIYWQLVVSGASMTTFPLNKEGRSTSQTIIGF